MEYQGIPLEDLGYPGKRPGDVITVEDECQCGARYKSQYSLRAVSRGDGDYFELALDKYLWSEKLKDGEGECFCRYKDKDGNEFLCNLVL